MEQEPLLSLSISGSKKGKKWAKSGPKEGGGGGLATISTVPVFPLF